MTDRKLKNTGGLSDTRVSAFIRSQGTPALASLTNLSPENRKAGSIYTPDTSQIHVNFKI
jgi:hypothetical protein